MSPPDISRNNTFTPTRVDDKDRYIDDLIHKINLLYKHLGLGRPIPPKILQELGVYYSGPYRTLNLPW